LAIAAFLLFSFNASAQVHEEIAPRETPASPASGGTDAERTVSWRTLLPNIASDQKRIWLFPVRLAQGRHLIPTLSVVAATGVLIPTDARTAGYFRRTDSFHGFNSVFTGKATELATWAAPLSLYVGGLIGRNSYARETALLAGEAAANAEIVTTLMKDIDRRRRPASYAPNQPITDSWFNSPGRWYRGRGSFPSGHSIAAFSIATVIVRRYPRQKWLPYVGYALAGAVAFSRVTLSSHFMSDSFVGAAMGYSIGRYAVLRR
jgi:hypothetical protein